MLGPESPSGLQYSRNNAKLRTPPRGHPLVAPVAWATVYQVVDIMLTQGARRVLAALCETEVSVPGGTLPLRRIAVRTLGDWQEGLNALAALDDEGYIRGSVCGWIDGWVTERGRAANGMIGSAKP